MIVIRIRKRTGRYTSLAAGDLTAVYSWVRTTIRRRNPSTDHQANKFEIVGKTYWKLRHGKNGASPVKL